MRMIDDLQFDNDSIKLELDPVARSQPSTRPPAVPAMPSYRRCFTHDLPMDSRGDCPMCIHAREAEAKRAGHKRLIAFVVAGLVLASLVLGTLGVWHYEAGAQKRAAAALTERYKTPVVVFTTRSCGACKIARNYMDANNIPYTERSLDGDALAVQEFDALVERQLVPVVVVGDEVQEGFSQLELERAMARHNVKRLPAARDKAPL